MNDDRFEELLARAGRTTPVPAALLERVVSAARPERPARHPPMPWSSQRVVLAIVAGAGAVTLFAAAASAAWWAGIPPFQSLEEGMYRVSTPIDVPVVPADGPAGRCEAFLEYRDLSPAQARQAEDYVREHDWAPLERSVQDALAEGSPSWLEAQSRVADVLGPVLERAAVQAVPEAARVGSATGGSAAVSGWSMSCRRATS